MSWSDPAPRNNAHLHPRLPVSSSPAGIHVRVTGRMGTTTLPVWTPLRVPYQMRNVDVAQLLLRSLEWLCGAQGNVFQEGGHHLVRRLLLAACCCCPLNLWLQQAHQVCTKLVGATPNNLCDGGLM
jgi:hypothetical protein